MRKFYVFVFALTSHLSYSDAKFTLSRDILRGETVSFLEHRGPGEWDSYLTMNLPFEPMAQLFSQLLIQERRQLTSRGEAHITVLTPVEYWRKLKPVGVTIEEVQQIALEKNIQASEFEILCLGSGSAKIGSVEEKTFYLVVKSQALLDIRSAIEELFLSKGGRAEDFRAQDFYPHVTLGFTKTDLHESDGVIKNEDSCIAGVELY